MHKFSNKIISTLLAFTLVGTNAIPAIAYAANETSIEENTIKENIIDEENILNQENNILETIESNSNFNIDAQATIKQELKRYLKYENKTLISFLVSSGIKENSMPILEKTIQIFVPKINDKEPSKIIVSGQEYTYQDQILLINKSYNEEISKIASEQDKKVSDLILEKDINIEWNSNDEFLVTYVYDSQINEDATNTSEKENIINTFAVVSAKTVVGNEIEAKTEEVSYSVGKKIGNLLETVISGDTEINKGYLYTNLNRTENKLETSFKTKYQVNIGFKELIDEIQIKDSIINDQILTRKVWLDKEELKNVLGEDGWIKVIDSNNQELGILNEENLELNIKSYGLTFITSKPIEEGYISLNLEKVFNTEYNYTMQDIMNMTELLNPIDVLGYLEKNQISNNYIENKINLVEPSSNASIVINKNILSTVVKNENVVITATLERNNIEDALYKNPELLIRLPSQIKQVDLKDARLIYEDELVPVTFHAEGNDIYLKLEGIQTKYNEIPNVKGTVIKIVADLTLDNLAVNSEEKIILQYTNRRTKDEIKSTEVPVRIVAPTGFIIANSGTLNETITSINEDMALNITANDKEKQINLRGTVISNLKESTKGLVILGRIPTKGTLSTDESNQYLNSTYSTKIIKQINVEGIEADIYYSDRENATYDLSNETNNWSLESNENTKSYLIVAKSEILPAQKIIFNYDIVVPQNLDYENRAYTEFSVYYDNMSLEGTSKNIISSKKLSIETQNIPIIRTEITASDFYIGDEIKNGDKIASGTYVKYVVRATNTGKKTAENVTLTVEKPESSRFYIEEKVENEDYYDNYFIFDSTLTKKIEKIEPGETVEYEYIVKNYSENEESVTFRTKVEAENMKENSTASFENIIQDATLEMRISTFETKEKVKIGDEINYRLSVQPYGSTNFNNVKITINIPKYIEILNCEGGSYDEETRILTYNIDSLENYTDYEFTAKVMYSDEPSQEISLVAKATYDGSDKDIKSNTYSSTILDLKGFSATFSSNVIEKMLDTDTVEYYVNIKNDSKKTANINIFNRLPDELKLVSYTVKNGNTTYTKENNILTTAIEENVEPGENLKVTIVAKPYILDSIDQIEQIENEIQIKVNDIDFPVNKINQQIQGTSNFNTIITNEEQVEAENIYSISGIAWYDENGNSAQDENETRMSSILLKLYDVNKKDFLKDENGNDIIVFTNDNGEYKFENLYNGQYIVIADYDSKVYKIANYQAGNLSKNEDNDFIEANKINTNEFIENSDTAATNVITINGESVYNLDLGLIDSENFNITINNKISKITVIDGDNSKTFDCNSYTANLQVNNKKIENATLVIEYLIEIKNDGNIDGYVTEVASKIQDNLEFVSELNQDWYIDNNNEAINSSLSNKLIKSGDSVTLKLILIKNNNEKGGELITNISEIRGTYNQYGIEEISRTQLEESKAKLAQISLSANYTNNIMKALEISVSILIVISLFAFGIYKLLEIRLNK